MARGWSALHGLLGSPTQQYQFFTLTNECKNHCTSRVTAENGLNASPGWSGPGAKRWGREAPGLMRPITRALKGRSKFRSALQASQCVKSPTQGCVRNANSTPGWRLDRPFGPVGLAKRRVVFMDDWGAAGWLRGQNAPGRYVSRPFIFYFRYFLLFSDPCSSVPSASSVFYDGVIIDPAPSHRERLYCSSLTQASTYVGGSPLSESRF